MLGLTEQLKNAKDDKERVKIQNQIIEVQRVRIDGLDDENKKLIEENIKLKEQVKEHEDLESILSSGSSISSAEGIDTKIDQNIKDLETLILNSKKSTATIRKEIKLLKKIKKLKFLNHQKDKEINELREGQTDFISSLNLKDIGTEIERIETLIEISKIKN